MSEDTAAAPNVDPDVALTDEAIDKGLEISRIEAEANAEGETSAHGSSAE